MFIPLPPLHHRREIVTAHLGEVHFCTRFNSEAINFKNPKALGSEKYYNAVDYYNDGRGYITKRKKKKNRITGSK